MSVYHTWLNLVDKFHEKRKNHLWKSTINKVINFWRCGKTTRRVHRRILVTINYLLSNSPYKYLFNFSQPRLIWQVQWQLGQSLHKNCSLNCEKTITIEMNSFRSICTIRQSILPLTGFLTLKLRWYLFLLYSKTKSPWWKNDPLVNSPFEIRRS